MLSRQYSALPSAKEELNNKVDNDDDMDEDLHDALHCITCGKDFKNKKQLTNHEESKKHKENVALIKDEIEGGNTNIQKQKNGKIEEKKDVVLNFSANPLFLDVKRGMHTSISSFSLPDDATLKSMEFNSELEHERENEFFEEVKGNGPQPAVDSLLYLKIKGISSRRCSLPIKEKKKSKNYSKFKDEDENVEDLASEDLLPNDSMVLFRTKTKKQELKDSAERVRMKTSGSDGSIQAALGHSSITDSMKIHKKRSTGDGSRFRKKLFGKDSVFNDG